MRRTNRPSGVGCLVDAKSARILYNLPELLFASVQWNMPQGRFHYDLVSTKLVFLSESSAALENVGMRVDIDSIVVMRDASEERSF